MYTLEIDGKKVTVDKESFFDRLKIEAEWLAQRVSACYASQTQGVPDIMGANKFILRRIHKALKNVVPQIEDEELRTIFHDLNWQAQRILADINKQLIAVIAGRVGLPIPRTKREAKFLEEKRQTLLYEETPLINNDYRRILKTAHEAIKEFRATRQRFDEKLAERLTNTK